jgi:acyl-coenzyme A synthetase/AMP-(fatty) acid ligase
MIVNSICDWAVKRPDKAAIICNDEPVSYAAFAHAIDAARRHLASQDLPAGQTAVVLAANIARCWFITLALRRLGLDTIVVRSLANAERLGFKDVATIVTTPQAAAAHKITGPRLSGRRVIVIPDDVWNARQNGTPAPIDDPDRPYGGHILYTSGTTGTYKKVLKEGRHEDAQSQRCAVYRLIEPDSVVHNLSFPLWTGVGYKQPLAVWRMGATLVVDNRPEGLRNFFRHRPTFVSVPPALAHELLAKTAAIPRPDRMPIVNLGGGFVSRQLINSLRSAKFDHVMINYSSTECSHILRSHAEDIDSLSWLAPVEDRHVEIVDMDDRPRVVGEEGMLRVALLDHDSHGYLDDPTTTASAFRDGWFYPGDLAVKREDGRIRILGRAGDVLNVRGMKVATAPMEQAICQLLDLENVCLFQAVDAEGAEELIVIVEADAVPAPTFREAITAEFKTFDRVRFTAVKPFPRTSMGLQKINRAELRKMVFGTPAH